MRSTTVVIAALSLLGLVTAHPHGRRHAHWRKHVKKSGDLPVVTKVEIVHPAGSPEVVVFVNQFGQPLSTMTEGMLAAIPSVWIAPTTLSPSSPPTTSSSPLSTLPAAVSAVALQAGDPEVSSTSPFAIPSPPSPSTLEDPPTPASTQEPQASPPAPSSTANSAASPPPPPPPPASVTPSPSATNSTPPAPPASSVSLPPPASGGYGFSYSPYKADGSCKTQDQVSQDFAAIGGGYSFVRIYGTDCNQVATVLPVAKAHGLKLFAGIFDLASLTTEIATIVAAAAGDWSSFDTISIGNELVNSGSASASAVVVAIGTARTLLKQAGYNGRVATVDTLVAARANPSLCDASDYCAVNSHPFFDGNVVAADAGSFLTTQIGTLRSVLADMNQEIVITETGWPTQGGTNGKAVPSIANQQAALSSIKTAFAGNPAGVVLFTVYNDLWKTNSAAQFGAEQFWGFLGNAPSG